MITCFRYDNRWNDLSTCFIVGNLLYDVLKCAGSLLLLWLQGRKIPVLTFGRLGHYFVCRYRYFSVNSFSNTWTENLDWLSMISLTLGCIYAILRQGLFSRGLVRQGISRCTVRSWAFLITFPRVAGKMMLCNDTRFNSAQFCLKLTS